MLRARQLRALAVRAVLALIASSILLLTAAGRGWLPRSLIASELRAAQSVLWVIAHPDDESFFFAPTFLSLLGGRYVTQGALLCLSVGDFDGAGHLRRVELKRSCAELGISGERCEVVDVPDLPDDPAVWWDLKAVETQVRQAVARWETDAIITFDRHGVSGHGNHRAVGAALQTISQSDPEFPPTFAVRSTFVAFKFTSFLLLPVVLAKHAAYGAGQRSASLFVNSWRQYGRARASFDAHASQARWFRSLFVTFSRYLWFVEVERV
ncbi:hypothetical protein JCM6882_006882 [Rhodosporidiobolus microsporus]